MKFSRASLSVLALGLSGAGASPLVLRQDTPTSTVIPTPETTESSTPVYDWSADWRTSYPIHQSCNSTQRAQLEAALGETVQLAQHARDHLLRFGNESEFVQKYFGDGPTATPIGWYDRVIAADKTGMTFRCDDPDRNCATQDGWAGHWRGENASSETVICDLSYTSRLFLSSMCGQGYTVAGSKRNVFWATDLLHRVLHVPQISQGIVDHFTEDYAGALHQAEEHPELSGIDSDVLQYFAVDVYAYDIAAPGVGCTGEAPEEEDAPADDAPTSTTSSVPSETSSAATECHTHDDGTEHCT